MAREDKIQAIEEIQKEQLSYLKKSLAVAKLPRAKMPETAIKRACIVLFYTLHIRNLEIRKRTLIAMPLLDKFANGGVFTGIGIEHGDEMVINKKSEKIFI